MTNLSRRTMLAGTAAASLAPLAGAVPAAAAAPQAGKQAPSHYRLKVGDYEVTVVSDGASNFPIQSIRNASADEVNAALEANYLPKGQLLTPYNVTLVNTGSKLILIDAGNVVGRSPTTGLLIANLAAAGIEPKAIDTIIISHFHGDHIGGLLTPQGEPIFTNAEIKVPATEWTYWMDDGNMSRAPEGLKANFANVRRIFGVIKNTTQYEAGKEVAPGITTIATPGHTPGHTSYVVASGAGKLLVQVDVTALTAVLIAQRPDWQIGGDMDGPLAVETRRKLYDMAAAERLPVIGYHLPFPLGYVEKSGNGYRFVTGHWNPVL